ncbi:xanthine dehydrogenase family protein molybdopterin-binding subunit [Herbidospora galbida]|uniref:Xanthine dehydrogenase family protein molybdopterin-binding subunit n=1 Tax=Herbidospora galbida TaxID=2575442 RepID=A0A4U3MJZ3_9ACTN|nr:xanthine dehydrogenase family protein molybdopterin-binding subunit [Herbidospora galbida]TKK89888.1 xanthine dehydrogenase family protein molybdopterin-binding subunit [Herbidospora galbida]
MTTIQQPRILGAGVDRVDGPLKVTGQARYPNDVNLPGMAYAAVVRSTIPSGRITRMDTTAAEKSPGVLEVITHENADHLGEAPATFIKNPQPPLQDDAIRFYGQYIAVVVADTQQNATAAAGLIEVEYERHEAILDPHDPRAERIKDPWGEDTAWGDVRTALNRAPVMIDQTYTTSENTNNPLGLFTTLASWDGDTLTLHDSNQWPNMIQQVVAAMFGLPRDAVRVLTPFVGGGFGAGLRCWSHIPLAVMAARHVGRPVKLELTRPEMFTGLGHRTSSINWIRLGATRDGRLTAIEHESLTTLPLDGDEYEPCSSVSTWSYASPNVTARDQQVRLNIPWTNFMRAPGDAQGNFALESAIDELAWEVGLDPLEIRLLNYAEVDPKTGRPWSSNALRRCLEVGAQRFGWSNRNPEIGSMRDGHELVGYGVAGVSFFWYQQPCSAKVIVRGDGSAYVRSAVTDIGTGTYTIMAQLAAGLLGLEVDQVEMQLGDSSMPVGTAAGGSGLTAALGSAVHDACGRLIQKFVDLAGTDPFSPLANVPFEDVAVSEGRLFRKGDPTRGESLARILAVHGLTELSADGNSTPNSPDQLGMTPAGARGARFVEVRVDEDLGRVRVARIVTVNDGGRILNEKLARSQILGGTVGGVGMALFEDTVTDKDTGRIANATFGDYLIPVNADIPDVHVEFVGEPDAFNPIGVKGIGEIGLVGVAPAIANGIFHATGKRIRSLPITMDEVMD